MSAKFYTLLTDIGAAKLASAAALGIPLKITHMAVGDGGGALPTPSAQQTALVAEKRRAALNMLYIDPQNSSQIIAEQVIPETEGGWWIREVGLFDENGALIAVGNCPESYKPQLVEGSGRTQTVRMVLITSSTDNITLKIDPAVVLATRKYVDDKVLELKVYVDDLMAKHLAAADPHTQYAPKASPTFTGTPKAPTAAAGNNSTQLANTAFVQAAIAALVASSPAALDTLNELAAALGNDPNFATTMTNALAGKMDKAANGKDIADVSEFLKNLQLRESFSGVVGTSRNAKMSVTVPAATATFSADELIVEESGGQQYRLGSFSKSVNLATVGAGGMDVGAPSVSGFIALYAIYNPTTETIELLAVDATSSIMPEIYGGLSLPDGFTASALISVWRVAKSKFVTGIQKGRKISIEKQSVITTTAQVTALTKLSVASIVPLNALTVSGNGLIFAIEGSDSSFGGLVIDIASTSWGAGYTSIGGYVGNYGIGIYGEFSEIVLSTPQAIFYDINPNGTSITEHSASIFINGYTI
ncbi:phage tail protein [Citrobacter sp. Igbk 17]|nr:phage tail protein [Citrobacter sp. Igbk 17]MDA8497960.1 phage tail protein [Citrobacter sp. Igbk 17]